MREPTQVLLTVDLEFSAGGFFEDPYHRRPVGSRSLALEIDGRSQGLGFLLETLQDHEIPATFFVEAAHVFYFGHGPMGEVVRDVNDDMHDLQLHLHPMWLACKDSTDPELVLAAYEGDSASELRQQTLRYLIDVGTKAFDKWGLRKPIAMRTGNLQANRDVYAIMEACGFRLASNIGLGVHAPKEKSLCLHGGRHWIGKILELPVLTYRTLDIRRRSQLRLLTIQATSFLEMRHLLESAYLHGVQQVVMLTHAHEFVKREDSSYNRIARNRITQQRLTQLCAFLRENEARFELATFSEIARTCSEKPDAEVPLLSVPVPLAARRMVENGLNDLFWNW